MCVNVKRCSQPADMAEIASYQWPRGTLVTWYLDPAIPAAAALAITRGIQAWPQVCGVRLAETNAPKDTRVLIDFEPIDPLGQILGLTDLPIGDPLQQVRMRLNSAVAWDPHELEIVALHEFGHGLGLIHTQPSDPAIMNPVYQSQLSGPQASDVAQAVARYGDPVQTMAALKTASYTCQVVVPGPKSFDIVFPRAGTYVITVAPAP